MRATLTLGLKPVARDIGRARRFCRELLVRAGHKAGRGNVVTAAGLLLFYLGGL